MTPKGRRVIEQDLPTTIPERRRLDAYGAFVTQSDVTRATRRQETYMALIEHPERDGSEDFSRRCFRNALAVPKYDRFRPVGTAVDNLRSWLASRGTPGSRTISAGRRNCAGAAQPEAALSTTALVQCFARLKPRYGTCPPLVPSLPSDGPGSMRSECQYQPQLRSRQAQLPLPTLPA